MNKRPKSNKKTGRSYEYDLKYQASEEQKKRRARRNRDRRRAIADGKVKKGDGKDIHHTDDDNMTGPVVRDRSKNRADKRK